MRVVVAHNRYASAQPSGENVVVDADIAQLRAAGVDVHPYLRSSDEISGFGARERLLLPVSPIYAPAAQADLRRLLRECRPDVLHLHNPYPLLSPWVVRTAHAAGVPVVQTVHNYRQVCPSGVFFRDGQICTECVDRRVAVPAVRHACYRGSRAQSLVMATALAVHRGTWNGVDAYLAPSAAIAEHLRRFGIAPPRIALRPPSVPDPGPPVPAGEGFLFLGRLVPEKGVGLLLRAWQCHPAGTLGTLRIAGDGPLRSLVDGARSDVEYLGPLSGGRVREELCRAAVVVTPSQWYDVAPTVIVEALASARPVLGTALGGIPDLIGAAGWTAPATVEALAAALPRARAEAAALVSVARQRYLAEFHPDRALATLLAVYRRVARV